jgi:large subunit ribosomal protein L24
VRTKIRKGDIVVVVNGREKDRGKRGEVIKVLPDEHRVVVQGLNLRKKHQRQQQTGGRRGLSPGIIEFEAPMDISNVMLICRSCNKPTRIAIQRDGDKVQRMCKKCNAVFD